MVFSNFLNEQCYIVLRLKRYKISKKIASVETYIFHTEQFTWAVGCNSSGGGEEAAQGKEEALFILETVVPWQLKLIG